ncbi:unnamed protein product [Strongylus vulgaris]|uniref:Uncharacterized protein n=1 Tax=Strongylus vulgaris TaxID=40348 RepID=A0A3P7IR16_STRVU|nr:unnamed protein product [Strongylus vulgaris]
MFYGILRYASPMQRVHVVTPAELRFRDHWRGGAARFRPMDHMGRSTVSTTTTSGHAVHGTGSVTSSPVTSISDEHTGDAWRDSPLRRDPREYTWSHRLNYDFGIIGEVERLDSDLWIIWADRHTTTTSGHAVHGTGSVTSSPVTSISDEHTGDAWRDSPLRRDPREDMSPMSDNSTALSSNVRSMEPIKAASFKIGKPKTVEIKVQRTEKMERREKFDNKDWLNNNDTYAMPSHLKEQRKSAKKPHTAVFIALAMAH